MKTPIAIIDLGTNTFHLMIINPQSANPYMPIYRQKEFVKLGEGGLDYILPVAFERGLQTMQHYAQLIAQYQITTVYAFATEGLRKATNSEQFIQAVSDACGIKIQCISGDAEALFIYHGICQAIQLPKQPVLMMDIGGGSVEFIIADQHQMYWKQSFRVGASVLKNLFHRTDPITPTQIAALNQHINATLQPLWDACLPFQLHTLIGSSGTFDTIADMQMAINQQIRTPETITYNLTAAFVDQAFEQLTQSNLAQRLVIPGMEAQRADLIPASISLLQYVIKQLNIQHIIQSEYAIKEGVIWAVLYQPNLLQPNSSIFVNA